MFIIVWRLTAVYTDTDGEEYKCQSDKDGYLPLYEDYWRTIIIRCYKDW